MDLILIPLQPNQPPARRAHTQDRAETAQNHTYHRMPQSAVFMNDHPQPTGR